MDGMAHPSAHLSLMLRELSNVSVLPLGKWIIELLVPRVAFIRVYIPPGIIECLLCAELGFSLALVDKSDKLPALKVLRICG